MSSSRQYDQRFYRAWHRENALKRFELKIEESDLLILCDEITQPFTETAHQTLRASRAQIKRKIKQCPEFEQSLTPVKAADTDSRIIKRMSDAGEQWAVGPMAGVAGAIAETVARALAPHTRNVIVENGGDIYGITPSTVRFALYAGEDSPFGNSLTFEVDASNGIAICTSSGKIGPSLSFGSADAVVAIHRRGSMADAAATAIANLIHSPMDIDPIINRIAKDNRLIGLIACMSDKLGLWGDITLIKG